MNKPPSSFPTNDCYIYERYKTFLLNNVSFMALVSFQVNFIRAAHRSYSIDTLSVKNSSPSHRKRTIDLLLLMASTRLDMTYVQSYISSMRNNDFNKKIYLERKSVLRQ